MNPPFPATLATQRTRKHSGPRPGGGTRGQSGRVAAARVAPGIPLRRPGRPAEIAAAVAWLLSADASYTTGAVVRVAGGR